MEEKNFLQNKKIVVKLVNKYRSGFPRASAGNTIWDGCKRVYQCPTNTQDRLIPILNESEQRFFEEVMGLEKNSLNFNKKEKNFWREYTVTLDKTGRTLNLLDAEDYIAWKVLLHSNSIAKSENMINELVHDYYMVDEDLQQEETIKLADRSEEAHKLLFNTIVKSDKKMINVLRLLGKQVPADAKSGWLKSELVKIIDQKTKVPGVPSMDEFIQVAKDPDFDTKVFLMDAIEIGEVYVEGTTYKLRSGDTIGFDKDQAISYFNNPKNQQTRLLIEDRITNNRK